MPTTKEHTEQKKKARTETTMARQAMKIVYRNISELKPNPKNPRVATDDEIASLARSISDNPKYFEARPVLLSDRTGELVIIGGEQRTKADFFRDELEALKPREKGLFDDLVI